MANVIESSDSDRVAQTGAFALSQLIPDDTRLTPHPRELVVERRSDRNAVHLVQNPLAFMGLTAPPGRDIRHPQILTEQTAGESGQESEQSTRLDHPGPRHILDRHAVLPNSLEQTGNADARRRIQLKRVAPIRVDMPPDDVASLEAGDGPNENPTLAHDEVVAFDQKESKIASQIGLLVIGRTQRARTENSNAWLGALPGGFQSCSQRAKERREALNIELRIKLGKGLRDDEPVFQRVAAARRGLRSIAEGPPCAIRTATDIDGVEAQPSLARRRHASHRGDIVHRAGDRGGGKRALGEQAPSPYTSARTRSKKLRALDDAFGDPEPLVFGERATAFG